VPPGLSRNGDSPEYRAFPEVAKINIDGGRGGQVLMEVPATAPASWETGEVHLRRWDILNHCMETDQGSVGVNIRRVVGREWRDLSSNPESQWAVARNEHTRLLDRILRVKDSGEVGRDPSWEVRICAAALIVEVYYDTGWVSDGVDRVSGDHFVKGGLGRSSIIDQRRAMNLTPIMRLLNKQKGTKVNSDSYLFNSPSPFLFRSFPGYLRCFPVESLMVRSPVRGPLGIHDIHIFSIDYFPSMMMTYYTEKARKKRARKQRAAGEKSKG